MHQTVKRLQNQRKRQKRQQSISKRSKSIQSHTHSSLSTQQSLTSSASPSSLQQSSLTPHLTRPITTLRVKQRQPLLGQKRYQSSTQTTTPNQSPQSQSNQSQQSSQQQQEQQQESTSLDNTDQIDPPQKLPPRKYRFAIPPQRLQRLPHVASLRDNFLSPLEHLNPTNFIYPDYALLMDFRDKESLLDWKIITDAELNGTSEATIAWGTAKNPITGEPMRTLVFQGRIGQILLPNQVLKQDSKSVSGGSSFFHMINERFNKSKTIQDSHGKLLQTIAGDPTVDYGDNDETNQDNPYNEFDYGTVHGFVGLMSPPFKQTLDLSTWDTLNMCVKTDGGPWLGTVKPQTITGNELYLAGIPSPDGTIINPRQPTGFLRKPMRNLFIPFDSLTVTRVGRVSSTVSVNSAHLVESFGFSIRGPPGPFKIEIGWIAVANGRGGEDALNELAPPDGSIKVELTNDAIEHAATLDDKSLYRFAHQNKLKMDHAARELAIKRQQDLPLTGIETVGAITVDEITSNQQSKNFRKLELSRKLGIPIDEIDDLIQDREIDPIDKPEYDNPEELPSQAQKAINKMTRILESTYSREDRLDQGIISTNTVTDDGQIIDASKRTFYLSTSSPSSADTENDIYLMQKRARKLTGSELPLIIPTYNDETVMAQARLNSLQRGFYTEKQWQAYTNSDKNFDPYKEEERLQQLAAKQFRQAYEHAYPDSPEAHEIRREAYLEYQEKLKEIEKQREFDAFYNNPGRIKGPNDGLAPEFEPPADIIEVLERNTYEFKGNRRIDPIDSDQYAVNQNQLPTSLTPEFQQELAEIPHYYELEQRIAQEKLEQQLEAKRQFQLKDEQISSQYAQRPRKPSILNEVLNDGNKKDPKH